MTLLFINGSGSAVSYHQLLLAAFASALAKTSLTTAPTLISARTHPAPNLTPEAELTSQDQAMVDELRAMAFTADAFVIASPEYNGGPTGALKNMIDWMTRPNTAHPKGNPFVMKPVVLLSASPGSLGGIKGLQVMRLIMGHLRALTLPEQVALGNCTSAFADDGTLMPGLAATLLENAAAQLADVMAKTAQPS